MARKKIILLLAMSLIIVAVGMLIIPRQSHAPTQSNTSPSPIASDLPSYEPQRGTLEGTVVCLPHADTSGPQTLECAMGVQTADGKYYALDTQLMSAIPPQYNTGDKIKANGIITPIERLSTDHWRKYNVQGIFSATDSFTII